MTRWQLIVILIKAVFCRDYMAAIQLLFTAPEQPAATPSPKVQPLQYDPHSRRMVRR